MSNDLDALIIRSLPELNEAAQRLAEIDARLSKAIDAEINGWIDRNQWKGNSDWQGSKGLIWLAPPDWMKTGADDDAFLYFYGDSAGAEHAQWDVLRWVGAGGQRIGLEITSDDLKLGEFKRAWKDYLKKIETSLPMNDDVFFLELSIDQNKLAEAISSGNISIAVDTLRGQLDRLPEYAHHLESFAKQIKGAVQYQPAPTA